MGSLCKSLCDIDSLCSSYVFDDEVGCLLYSDVALLHHCDGGDVPRLVNVGQGHTERDALVGPLTGQCFIEFEDTREIGCYALNGTDIGVSALSSTQMTPFLCQGTCENLTKAYYMVLEDQCYCSDRAIHLDEELSFDVNCTSPCSGDSTQTCGASSGSILVGETNLPLFGLTLVSGNIENLVIGKSACFSNHCISLHCQGSMQTSVR